jgi:hypothetical protein
MNLNLKMQEEIGRLGHLKNAAAAIVDYVRTVSAESDFQPCYGWKLDPDNWILLSFSTKYPTVTVSLAVQLETLEALVKTLPEQTGLKLSWGRRVSWSRIYLKDVRHLPVALRCIQYAYYYGINKYRKRHGKPTPPDSRNPEP